MNPSRDRTSFRYRIPAISRRTTRKVFITSRTTWWSCPMVPKCFHSPAAIDSPPPPGQWDWPLNVFFRSEKRRSCGEFEIDQRRGQGHVGGAGERVQKTDRSDGRWRILPSEQFHSTEAKSPFNTKTKSPFFLSQLFSDNRTPFRKAATDSTNAAPYSTGHVAASFTSTAMEPITHQTAGDFFFHPKELFAYFSLKSPGFVEASSRFRRGLVKKIKKILKFFFGFFLAAMLDEDVLLYDRVRKRQKKGYVRLITNFGSLNVELHADLVSEALFFVKRKWFFEEDFRRRRRKRVTIS